MLPRRHVHPDGHWSLGFPTVLKQGVACGPLIFIAGQVDLSGDGKMLNPGDLMAQTRASMTHVGAILNGYGADVGDLVKLTVFYVSDGTVDETDLLEEIAAALGTLPGPGPAIAAIPVPALAFDGMMVEIEGIAMRDQNGPRLPRAAAWSPDGPALPRAFSQALRCGAMIFSSGITAADGVGGVQDPGSLAAQSRLVLPKIDRLLRQLGADLGDSVKTNVFNVEPGKQEEWKEAALIRGSFYPEPGPAATGISVPALWPAGAMVKNDVIAMRAPDGSRLPRRAVWPSGHWDWPVHLPYRHGLQCGDLVFLGGQVSLRPDGGVIDPGDMAAQTHTAMANIARVLAELALTFDHVVKINTFYVGGASVRDLRRNAEIRAGCFREPGPASTGVPMPYLAYEDMVIEIDVVAML